MRRAIELSLRGEGLVEPNPMVGCVIVRGGKMVGEGWHKKYGGPHAEVHALKQAAAKAKGATAYVTLEPCSHFGKTPPCADALIAAGIKRVVAAVKDPNSLVLGKGFAKLRKAGIRVEVGLLADEASEVLAPFVTCQMQCRPYVILKWAQSIDGKIATRTGDSKWITCEESRSAGHALRARVDAVIVGIGTVLADNPELTARLVKPKRIATRIVLDRFAQTPLKCKLVVGASKSTTMICCGRPAGRNGKAQQKRMAALMKAGCEVRELPLVNNRIDLVALLHDLRMMGATNVMVEGGGQVLGSFFEKGLADEAHIFVAPKLIGGTTARAPLECMGPREIDDIIGLHLISALPSGADVCYRIRFDVANPGKK